MAHVDAVHRYAAFAHVVESRQQLAQRRLSASGRADDRKALPRRDVQVNVAENGYAVAVIKADVVIIYFTLNCSKLHGVRRVFYRRLRAHDLKEAREPCRSLHVKLRKLRQLPHRRHKGRDIEREGDKVDVIHLILHDE